MVKNVVNVVRMWWTYGKNVVNVVRNVVNVVRNVVNVVKVVNFPTIFGVFPVSTANTVKAKRKTFHHHL